ncbi:MAG: hypothetical protein ACKVHQ_04660 [Gammaproteobacteria bacterium]
MAGLTWVILQFYSEMSAIYILLNIPPFMTLINTALIIAIAVSLKLSLPFTILAVACFSFSPLTQELHLSGRIDHHMIEYSFVLSTILFGILWLKNQVNTRLSVIFGMILGVAPAFHNGLFILQLPLLLTLIALWFCRRKPPDSSKIFIASLIFFTGLTLLPSEPFLQGKFSFYYHSWFHLYIASCTSLVIFFLIKTTFNIKNVVLLISLALILTTPLVSELFTGINFISGENILYQQIDEMKSPLEINNKFTFYSLDIIGKYSSLFLLLPISLIILLVWYRLGKEPYQLYLLIFSIFSTTMLLSQLRLHYFGSYVLYFPLLIGAKVITEKFSTYRHATLAVITLIFMISYIPSMRKLFDDRPLGGSFDYALTHTIYEELTKSCTASPGTVLADFNDGHFISFHTECAVIANIMVISPMDFERIDETQRLMGLTVDDIVNDEDWINYIYVRREDNIYENNDLATIKHINRGLRAELLFNNVVPAGLSLLASASFDNGNQGNTILAKVFKIER